MKPKRPTETDLLALVQNGFNDQLPKDRETHPPATPAPPARREALPAREVQPLDPMVRITLTIPEDLRFRLRVALMTHHRQTRARMTQDEFCAKAIAAHLEHLEGPAKQGSREERLAAFLQDCLREKGLSKAWAPKAKQVLDGEVDGPNSREAARQANGSSDSGDQGI